MRLPDTNSSRMAIPKLIGGHKGLVTLAILLPVWNPLPPGIELYITSRMVWSWEDLIRVWSFPPCITSQLKMTVASPVLRTEEPGTRSGTMPVPVCSLVGSGLSITVWSFYLSHPACCLVCTSQLPAAQVLWHLASLQSFISCQSHESHAISLARKSPTISTWKSVVLSCLPCLSCFWSFHWMSFSWR